MRSRTVTTITVGTALLGATGLVGVAATATQAAPGTRPVPSPVTDTVGAASLESAPVAADPVGADAADAQRTPESALAQLRGLIRNGVPGASPELDARLTQALRTADQAVTTLQAHTSARELTRSWVHATRPGTVPESVELPGASALDKVYGSIPVVPAGAPAAESATPRAADTETAETPDLGTLLGAVTALDLAGTLDALTDLLDGVLSTLTSTVFGITGSLTGLV